MSPRRTRRSKTERAVCTALGTPTRLGWVVICQRGPVCFVSERKGDQEREGSKREEENGREESHMMTSSRRFRLVHSRCCYKEM